MVPNLGKLSNRPSFQHCVDSVDKVYGLMNCGETMLSAFALLGLVLYVFGVLGLKAGR